jgi:hypothetical protein
VLTFFIAGLLYLLCFEHVDNLGAYSIPPETGLLIPSGYVKKPSKDWVWVRCMDLLAPVLAKWEALWPTTLQNLAEDVFRDAAVP